MAERGQNGDLTVSEYLYLLNHTESQSVTISSLFQLCLSLSSVTVVYLIKPSGMSCVCIKNTSLPLIYLNQFCLLDAGTLGHLYTA